MYVRGNFLVQPPNCSFDKTNDVQLWRNWVSRVTLLKIDPLRRSSARHECVRDLLRHPCNDLCLEYEGQRGVERFLLLLF